MGETQAKRPNSIVYIVVTLILVCGLAGAGVYWLKHKNKPKQSTTAYIQSKINFDVSKANCNKRLLDLVHTDVSKLSALDGAKILSQRGNCYSELGRYEDALKTYQEMQKLCAKQTEDSRCAQVALYGIQDAKAALDSQTGAPGQ
jgi:uncharacterized membrane protein